MTYTDTGMLKVHEYRGTCNTCMYLLTSHTIWDEVLSTHTCTLGVIGMHQQFL